MKIKKCSKCGIEKEISNFYKNITRKDGYTEECKPCKKERQRLYRTDPKRERKYNLKKKYGITPEQFDQMLKKQNGMCKICGTKTPKGRGNFHVDHNHKTGNIRGLLCSDCNTALGLFKDNSIILVSAIRYLKAKLRAKLKATLVRETSGPMGTIAGSSPAPCITSISFDNGNRLDWKSQFEIIENRIPENAILPRVEIECPCGLQVRQLYNILYDRNPCLVRL